MHGKRFLSVFLAVAFSVLCSGMVFAAPKYVIKVGYIVPETQSDHIIMRDVFKKEVESQSGGQIKVELYPNAQLGGDRELTESVQLGTIQMALPATSALAGFDKRFQALDLPFLFKSKSTAYKALDGELGKKLNQDLPALGMINLGYGENGFRHITNNRGPITKPADLKGLKIRTMENPMHIAFFKLLGANPTPMNFGELYTALQQKTVDAQENPIALIYTSKFYEVQKYCSLTGHVYSATALIMNKKFFDNLPPNLKTIVTKAAHDYVVQQRKLSDKQEKEFLVLLRKNGMVINDLTPAQKEAFVKATLPVYDSFRDVVGGDLIDLAKKIAGTKD